MTGKFLRGFIQFKNLETSVKTVEEFYIEEHTSATSFLRGGGATRGLKTGTHTKIFQLIYHLGPNIYV